MNDTLLAEEILKYSNGNLTRNSLFLLESVDSTNTYCKRIINDKTIHQTLVVANTQTSGKGRMGRTFFSPKNTGIYMSLILDCESMPLPTNLLTIAAGVAVCRTLKTLCNSVASIKWVNDIFIDGKKVCGILAESIADHKTSHLKYIILGIGINISTPDNIFPEYLNSIAGSIFPGDISRNKIIAQIVTELSDLYMDNDPDNLVNEYKSYSLVLGKKINFTLNGKNHTGIATDINNDGNLVVQSDNKKIVILKSGEVSLGSKHFVKKDAAN